MKLAIPPIELTRGTINCLHIPHECEGVDMMVETQILQLAGQHGKAVGIARPAEVVRSDKNSLEQSCADWLSDAGSICHEESVKIIAGLGVKVAEKLAWNPGTPRSLLGIAAALLREPDVLVYAARGLDVEGCWRVHRFVRSKCKHLCVVHVSYPHVFGDGTPHPRDCPAGARCVTLTVDL